MSKLTKLEELIRLDVRDAVAASLPDGGVVRDLPTETWLDDLYEETVRVGVDSALICTADVRQLWEELGEPDPELLDYCTSIDHAILTAVQEVLMVGGGADCDLYGAARLGAFEALAEWASKNNLRDGEYSGDDPLEYIDEIRSYYEEGFDDE